MSESEEAEARAARSVIDWRQEDGPRPKMNIHQKLAWVQKWLVVNKHRNNNLYHYRNASDILVKAKPLCHAVEARVEADCEPQLFGGGSVVDVRVVKPAKDNTAPTYALFSGPRIIAICSAIFTDCETGETIVRRSYAEQDNWRKGQEEPEKRSGSTDSYGTKYALCHLFAIDDTQDADELSKPPDPGF